MARYFAELLSTAVSHAAFAAIYLFPMWKTRDVKKKFVVIYLICLALFICIALAVLMLFFTSESALNYYIPTVISLSACALPFLVFRKRAWQIVFLLAISFLYSTVPYGLGRYMSENLLEGYSQFFTDIIGFLVITVTLPPLLIILRRLCGNQDMKQAVVFWRLAWLVPAVFFLIIIFSSSYPSGNINTYFVIIRVIIYLGLLLICYLFEVTVREISVAEAVKREAEYLAGNIEMLRSLNLKKTEFLQDMSHEMKAPLTVIATGADFADREINKASFDISEVSEALDTIRDETQRLGRMVQGMVELASIDEISVNRRRVDLAELIRNCAEAVKITMEQHSISLELEIAPDMPDVYVESDRFIQIMLNLLNNAAEHTSGGRVEVTADYDSEYITVRVADTGGGISSELLPLVFERGVSGRNSTGYGLYICKTVVEAHGGTISIESALGEGTTAAFTVPVYGGQEAGHGI